MVASCAFGNGLGKKKIMGLLKVFPNILNDSLSVEQICKVQGFSDKSAKKVLDGVCIFKQFFEPIKEFVKLKEGNVVKGDKFQGKKFVFSGFRDNTLKTEIESFGGIVTDSVSSKTYAVIVKDKDEVSSKLTKARELNVKIITKMELN
jgi:NAD-dependent DNA ligase